MHRFQCPSCGHDVFFEDTQCLACGFELGYVLDQDEMAAAEPGRRCTRFAVHGCPWLAGPEGVAAPGLCLSCSLDIGPGAEHGDVDYVIFQGAKRRVVRQLHRAGLDVTRGAPPVRFDLRRSTADEPVTIGHADGVITLDVREADPVSREEVRLTLGEPYRTAVGHVRHETGHWHWQRAVEPDPELLVRFRELFGDDTVDYATSLEQHYGSPDDGSWQDRFVSHYAAAHPWEDYAESFAHVLHLADTMETAQDEGLVAKVPDDFDARYTAWVALTLALNELSRSMGAADPYPFAPAPAAVAKMRFVHQLIGG